jgi:hypothetical protein
MNKIIFRQRWKEELVAVGDEGVLVFECTAGKFHIYFPDRQRWIAIVPAWATNKWEIFAEACSNWCMENNIPISFVPDAHVYEENIK